MDNGTANSSIVTESEILNKISNNAHEEIGNSYSEKDGSIVGEITGTRTNLKWDKAENAVELLIVLCESQSNCNDEVFKSLSAISQ